LEQRTKILEILFEFHFNLQLFQLEDVYDRSKIPRMPWQDYHSKVIGEPARDVARNFMHRWLCCKDPKKHNFISLRETDYSKDEKLAKLIKENEKDLAEVQVLRCTAYWSIQTNMTEVSPFFFNLSTEFNLQGSSESNQRIKTFCLH
jgi:phosphatidylserine/phosphatidylglycerophosphate/cardiolipin synthase-like enzyme